MAESENKLDELQKKYDELIRELPPSNFDRTSQSETIYQVLTSIAGDHFLHSLQQSPEVLSALRGDGSEYTVFLPDVAVQASQGNLERLTSNDFVSLHVSPHYITVHESLLHMSNIPVCSQTNEANGPHVFSSHFAGGHWQIGNRSITSENICCSNGIIHKIASPFAAISPYLEILQTSNTTIFLRAFEQSEVSFPTEMKGCTIFAPVDSALSTLPEDITKFLFATSAGMPYLQALIKVHLVPNLTVYSNLIWPKNNTGQRMTSRDSWRNIRGKQTQELPTLLEDPLGNSIATTVTIIRCNHFIQLFVNSTAKVIEQDIGMCEGVVQGIDRILLPGSTVANNCTLEQLKQILGPYIKIQGFHIDQI